MFSKHRIITLIEQYDNTIEQKRVAYIDAHRPAKNAPSLGSVIEIADISPNIGACLKEVRLSHRIKIDGYTQNIHPTQFDLLVDDLTNIRRAFADLRKNNHVYPGIIRSSKQLFDLVGTYTGNESVYTCLIEHRDELNTLFQTHLIFMPQRPHPSCFFDLEKMWEPSTIQRNTDINALFISIAMSRKCTGNYFSISMFQAQPLRDLYAIPRLEADHIYFENYEVLPY